MLRPTRVEIHVDRLVQNALLLKKWAGPNAFFCPMVKADAYGHGAGPIASELHKHGISQVGVALVEEGISLRQSGFAGEILVFGPLTGNVVSALEEFRLTPVISRFEDLEKCAHRALHLKFNTGMSRLGFSPEDAPELAAKLSNSEVVGICTHLSHGDDAGQADGYSQRQFARFKKVASHFPRAAVHALNSSGLLALLKHPVEERSRLGCRPGIALYGIQDEIVPEIKPVLEWKTQVVLIQNVKKGSGVSYGGRWVAPQDSWIGIVPLGYADGYTRALSQKSEMLFRGQRVKVVGTVCMDYTLLDLTSALKNHDKSAVGEEVVVIGKQGVQEVSACELARLANTISYEIATHISGRVPRHFLGIK